MKVQVWRRCEIVLHSQKTYDNPFMDVTVDAAFTAPDGTVVTLPGFWNGENEWKVRFSPNKPGLWTYTVTCSDADNADLTASGTVEAFAGEPANDLEKHGFVKLTPGSRFMTYDDGTPFFWLGDTHWQMPDLERLNECNCPGCTCGNQFKHLADDRIQKGFTVYQTYFDSAESDGGGLPHKHPWWTEKFTRINPQSFNETMDVMMEYLADHGMTVAIGMGVHTSTPNGFRFDPAPMLAFARYVVARYACYPVVWITAQEITIIKQNSYELWKQVGELVWKLDGYHHPNGAHQYVHQASAAIIADLDSQPWHQWWTLQSGHGDVSRLQHRFFYQGYHDLPSKKVYIETECHYEDLGSSDGCCSSDAARVGAWNAILSGSAGFTYGVTGVWAMNWDKQQGGWNGYSPEPWYLGMQKHGSLEMGIMKTFFEYLGWGSLEPSFGYDLANLESRKETAIAHRGQDVVVYYFYGTTRECGKMIGLKPNVTYRMRWFDPIDGLFVDLPSFTTTDGTYPLPARPSQRDWVLLINCVDLGPAPFGAYVYPHVLPTITPQEAKLGKEWDFVSVSAASTEEGYPASNMIDGKEDTVWRGYGAKTAQTIIADLGEKRTFGYLGIFTKMENFSMVDMRVYGSDDGEHYTLLTERIGRTVGIGGQYSTYYDPVEGSCRFVKIVFPGRVSPTKIGISKICVFEKGE